MGRKSFHEDPGCPEVLELVVIVAVTGSPVGELQMYLDRITLDLEPVSPLDRPQPLKSVPVVVQLDLLSLAGEDCRGFIPAPKSDQGLGLRHPRVRAERPVI